MRVVATVTITKIEYCTGEKIPLLSPTERMTSSIKPLVFNNKPSNRLSGRDKPIHRPAIMSGISLLPMHSARKAVPQPSSLNAKSSDDSSFIPAMAKNSGQKKRSVLQLVAFSQLSRISLSDAKTLPTRNAPNTTCNEAR